MYLPKFKYKKESGAGKQLLDAATGAIVSGPIIIDFLGRIFKGSNPVTATEQLIEQETAPQEQDTFINQYIQPTDKDYLQGKFIRYFIKDSRLDKVIEVNKDTFLQERRVNKLYRRTLRLEWYIAGPVEDTVINGYTSIGARTKNQNIIDQAEKELPGISVQILKDPTQFVK